MYEYKLNALILFLYVREMYMSNVLIKESHMSNTLDWIPVDKTWSPMESGGRMKPEVQSSPLELPEV